MSCQDPVKASRFFAVTEKPREIFVVLLRIGILVCVIIFISLAVQSVVPRPAGWLFPLPEHIHVDMVSFKNQSSSHIDSGPTSISHILFGIAGSASTWQDRFLFSNLWWDPNRTRGFVWLDKKPEFEDVFRTDVTVPYKISDESWTKFEFVHSQSAVRIARIVRESFKLGLPNVRWFVMGDDDTVFFLQNLVSVLGRYDHKQMLYIGGNSESVEQNEFHGYGMAFGGGGFAISYALAARLVKIFDDCLHRYYYFYGSDQRVWACVSELGVPLTKEFGFHQLDIRGDPYGILAAHPLTPLVSLHHLDQMDPIFPNETPLDSVEKLMVPYHVDPARIMQQSICYDHKRRWSISISWGYTVQVYPTLWTAKDLQTPFHTFRTWGTWSNGPFTFNTRPLLSDPCETPAIFFLDKVKDMGRDRSWSFSTYTRFTPPQAYSCAPDRILPVEVKRIRVAALKLDPTYWKKAPLRQCCQVMDGGSIKNGTLRLRIRKCNRRESITI